MNRPRKGPMNLRGVDELYSREIVDDYARDDEARKSIASKYRQSITPPVIVAIDRSAENNAKEDNTKNSGPQEDDTTKRAVNDSISETQSTDGCNPKIYVRPKVPLLKRQQEELDALADEGYNIDIVLRRARQQTQRKFKLKPVFSKPELADETAKTVQRFNIPAYLSDLKVLSEQAGDLGTLPYTQLIVSQVQSLWIKELDAIITDLKRKRL